MTEVQFNEAMNLLEDRYLTEAIEYRAVPKKKTALRGGVLAAAIAAVVLTAAVMLPKEKEPAVLPPEPPAADRIEFNELKADATGCRLYLPPEKYDRVIWEWQDCLEYLGKDPTPSYVPAGLTASPGNGRETVFREKVTGKMLYTAVHLGYYHDFYEDGSPCLNEEAGVAAVKGVSIKVSREKRWLSETCYDLKDGAEVKTSEIEGRPVVLGHRLMPYGPYDEETHEPAGYYDLYLAEFKAGELYYEIITEGLLPEEICRVTASILKDSP